MLFQLVITVNQKNISRLYTSYQTHSHNLHFNIMGLELTIERSYQTHSHKVHFKMTGLVKSFLRRNMSSSRIHRCYIIIGTVCVLVTQSCLCDPMDCSPPGSFVYGILQARILEQVAISSSRGSSLTRNRTHISCIGRQICYH